MDTELVGSGLGLASAVSAMAWAVRGKSAQVFAPSVWRGDSSRRSVALTFDDGPSESTPALLELLATFRCAGDVFYVRQECAPSEDGCARGCFGRPSDRQSYRDPSELRLQVAAIHV